MESFLFDGPVVVVIVAYRPNPPTGFEAMTRDALSARPGQLREQARASNAPAVLHLHVLYDTVPPVAVMRVADVVLNVTKARHG